MYGDTIAIPLIAISQMQMPRDLFSFSGPNPKVAVREDGGEQDTNPQSMNYPDGLP